LRVPPIGSILLPETSLALSNKGLRIFSGEVKVLGSRFWSAKLFDKILIPPA
jgi:hypothetical protein